MITQTVKSCLKMIKFYAGDKEVRLVTEDPNSKNKYIFTVTSKDIFMEVVSKSGTVRSYIEDIEMTVLPLKLIAHQYRERTFFNKKIERNGELTDSYETYEVNIRFEAHLFIRIFKLMRERAFFTIKHNRQTYDCYYIDGKVFYIDITEDEYRIMGTDLFKLNNTFDGYKIQIIDRLPVKFDVKTFYNNHDEKAASIGKKFVKYLNEQRV